MADILSQEEVDLLLAAVADGELGAEPETAKASDGPRMASYDFRRPERVSKEQLKGLQSLFEAFSREVSIVLPPFLRTVVRVDLVAIDQLTYDEFILSVARPTALAVINMSPLDGNAVIELSPSMIFPIVDRVLGGKGAIIAELRELTEIETRIVTRITMMMLDCLRRSWDQLIEFRLSINTIESDPLIVQVVAGSEMIILVGYEVHIGNIAGTMNMCIPLVTLAPIVNQISQQTRYTRRMSDREAATIREVLERSLSKATVSVDAILGQTTLPLQEVAKLQVGDIVQLGSSPHKPIVVEVASVPRFFAQPGRQGENSAVQLTSIIRD